MIVQPEIDTVILLSNNGNVTLNVTDIYVDPPPPFPFRVEPGQVNILPSEKESVKVIFSTYNQQSGIVFNANLIIVSNSRVPNDTVIVRLSAMGIEPQLAEVTLPNIKSKPGRRIAYPVLIDKNKISQAKTFTADILFDPSLLMYVDKRILATAVEAAEKVKVGVDTALGKLQIDVSMANSPNSWFYSRDTLILLIFDTYLGERVSAPISIIDPKFGNEICNRVLTPSIKNGSFALDSVCGLDWKAVPIAKRKFVLADVYPNPSDDNVFVEISQAFDENVNVSFFNSYGNNVMELASGNLSGGVYTFPASVAQLAPGTYYCVFQSGRFHCVKPFVVLR